MKRPRENVYMNPQFKRPFATSSRGESYAPSLAPIGGGVGGGGVRGGGGVNGGIAGSSGSGAGVAAGSTPKLTTNDALTYLKEVKDMFQDQKEKYDTFLDVMKDFKAQRVDTAGVIGRVKALFKGHPNLILGFNAFLPKGYEITLTDEEKAPPKKTVEFEEAITFVNKIKKRFQSDDRVYKCFLDILNMYRKEHKGIKEVYQEVAELFQDQPDLLDEFTRFLPYTSATSLAPTTSFGRHPLQRYDERSSAVPSMRQSHIDKRPRRDRINAPHERDLSVECPVIDDKTVMKCHKEQMKHSEREIMDKRARGSDERDPNTEKNGSISFHSDKRKAARKIENFEAIYDDKDAFKSMYNEFTFLEKVKERLQSADDYQAFLKCLNIYSTEIITRKELQSLVSDLLGKYSDLMETFNEFLVRCEETDGFLAGVMGKSNSSKALRIEEKDKEQKHEVEGGKENDRSLRYWGKSINDLDLSNCQRCTPSYRLLPDDYPIPSASHRSELGEQVLNDHWVSVTSGSEDYSFKHMRRNQYEESLFRCEDDRFELDMLLESVSSASKRAEELLDSINNNTICSNSPIQIEDHFTVLNLRCIERLYGDHGLDVMDILRKNPSMALPVVLTRLKQKHEEWSKCRSDFNKVWAEIYSKNHYKSLDHRSFYFKQQDSKNLSTKSLVAEIKEIKEKSQKDDDILISIAAGSRHSIIPNLEFEYPDAEIHEDVYKIIKYSCEEVCSTKELVNKVLGFWTTFFEPMMGVQPRPQGSEDSDDDGASEHEAVKFTVESEGSPCPNDSSSLMQQKPNCNVDSNNTSLQHLNFSRANFTKSDALAKGINAAPSERLNDPDLAVTSGPDANCERAASLHVNNGLIEDGNGDKANREDILSSEGAEKSKLNQINGELTNGAKLAGYSEDYVGPCKNEKEEGELSSNGDFEDNFGSYRNAGTQALPEKNGSKDSIIVQTGSHEEICTDPAGDNEADADDENSENISEAGEDVSGSESAANECSREEQEEDAEHDELDAKAESEGEVENISEAHDDGDGTSVPQSEHRLQNCKPLLKHVASQSLGHEKKNQRVFYGNDNFYVLFRLHQTLYERILSAKVSSPTGEPKWKSTKDEKSELYERFMSSVYSLLDGSSDNTKFEDDCRSLIGNQSYILFTLDKLIYKLVKQLQTVSTDELDSKLLQLYEYETSRTPKTYVDSVYYENVHVLLHDENIYRLECMSDPACLSIQLMDGGNEKSEVVAVSVDPKFANYLHNGYLSIAHGKKESSAIFLKRNSRKYADIEESTALDMEMGKVVIMNGLECKMSASSSKVSYVLDTEDFYIHLGRRRENRSAGTSSPKYQDRVQRFNRFLAASL